MNIRNLFINEDNIDQIFNNLSLNSKINFAKINKFTYNTYYKNIIFEIIKNNNYELFKIYLNNIKFTNDEYIQFFNYCIQNISKIKLKYYLDNEKYHYFEKLDLRLIFELLLIEYNKNLNFLIDDIDNTLLFYIKEIKRCIYLDRTMSIWNINSNVNLIQLHSKYVKL